MSRRLGAAMIGIPLSLVVAFLRPRGALGVLEGAPFFYAHEAAAPYLRSVNLRELTQIGNVERVATVLLYLGSGDVCPAAEGWAARVLAIAQGSSMPCHIQDCGSFLCMWPVPLTTAEPYYTWQWVDHDFGAYDDYVRLRGPKPSTPAERLAAVLTYEMERAK